MKTKSNAASFTRRLLALLYDLILLLAVLFAISAIAVAINKGEAATHPAYYLCLLLTTFVFFGWFWTHGGQTLGMRTWKIKIINDIDESLTWKQALIRFAAAALALIPAGIGLIWVLIDKESLAWHDRLSKTRLISLKAHKNAQQAENDV